jgi:hypothetical protein
MAASEFDDAFSGRHPVVGVMTSRGTTATERAIGKARVHKCRKQLPDAGMIIALKIKS